MEKNYLVIGAGKMGEAIAYDLLQAKDTAYVGIGDYHEEKAKQLKKKLDDERAFGFRLDASDEDSVMSYMLGKDAAIGAASYDFNEILTRAAISAGTNFCDLGGNNTVVETQFKYSNEAKEKRVRIIPDCGIAPGAVSVVAMRGIEKLKELGVKGYPDYVKIRVGGLPQNPQGQLKYQIVFSVHGLINEYIEPTEILNNGKIEKVDSMTGLEELVFHDFNGMDTAMFEAAYTSGGSSTLTKTFRDKIQNIDYKTIRYPGHWEKIRFLNEMGFFSKEHRLNTEKALEESLSYNGKDCLLMRVCVGKRISGGILQVKYDMIDYFDEKTGMSAMQRTTGFSASIIAQMMADNTISKYGVLRQEDCAPPRKFMSEWKKRNIIAEESVSSR